MIAVLGERTEIGAAPLWRRGVFHAHLSASQDDALFFLLALSDCLFYRIVKIRATYTVSQAAPLTVDVFDPWVSLSGGSTAFDAIIGALLILGALDFVVAAP